VVAVGRSDEALPVAVPDDAVISKHASEALHAHVDTVAAQVDAHLPVPRGVAQRLSHGVGGADDDLLGDDLAALRLLRRGLGGLGALGGISRRNRLRAVLRGLRRGF
jgi:hypothetical protein